MISSKQISKAVVSLSNEGKDTNNVLQKLMNFVEKHKLENYLPQILENIKKESLKQKQGNTLFVETPFEEDNSVVSKVAGLVGTDGGVLVQHKVNKNIIGGFKAYHKDKKYDGSLENVLRKLEQRLKEN